MSGPDSPKKSAFLSLWLLLASALALTASPLLWAGESIHALQEGEWDITARMKVPHAAYAMPPERYSKCISKEKMNPAEIRTATLVHLSNSEYVPTYYGVEMDWAWLIWPWNRREDLVNLTNKLKTRNADEVKKEMKERFNIDIEKEEIVEVIEHMEELGLDELK